MQAIDSGCSGCSVLNHTQVGIPGAISGRVTYTHNVNPSRPVYLTSDSFKITTESSGKELRSPAERCVVCTSLELWLPAQSAAGAGPQLFNRYHSRHGMKAGLRALC